MSYDVLKGVITIYHEYDKEDSCQKYYDSEGRYLGGEAKSYQFVKQCFQMGGIAVKETTDFDRFEECGGDREIERHDTKLYFEGTEINVCTYREEKSTFWGPNPCFTYDLIGSDYVIVKPKSEWKAPAAQATPAAKPTVKTELVKTAVLLHCTEQDLREKYHAVEIGERKAMWRASGGGEFLNTKLYLGKETLGTLKELSMMPNGMIQLRNHLAKITGKKFECQCRSEIVLTKEGMEKYRQVVCLAEEGKLNQNSLNSMVFSSMICVAYLRDLSSDREMVNLFWKKACEDFELHIYK